MSVFPFPKHRVKLDSDLGSLRYAERGSLHQPLNRVSTNLMINFTHSCRDPVPPWLSASWSSRKVRGHYKPLSPNSVLIGVLDYSGKTSLIHSIAGELGLDIYVVSLSAKG